MKLKNIVIKGLSVLFAAACIATVASLPVKADPYDCLAGNHAWKFDYTYSPATCEKPAHNIYYCTTCLKGIDRFDVPPLGHKMDKGHIIVMPTATTDGFLVYRCEHCGKYMGDAKLPATDIPLPQTPQTPSPALLNPYVQSPLEKVPTYFDPNMLAVCYIPYHSIVTLNGVGVNIDAIGAQPLAPLMQAPGKYVITVTPNTNPEHSKANIKTFEVTIPSKPGKPVTVVNK